MRHIFTTIDIQALPAAALLELRDLPARWKKHFSGPLGPLCARLTHGLTARYLAMEARGLKQRAEAEARPQASTIGSAGESR